LDYIKGELIYEGKAKRIFSVKDHDNMIWQEFKDSFTAFNGEKKAQIKDKGKVNREIASILFKKMMSFDIPCHWVADHGEIDMITEKLTMIDLEVVVRNILAGSTAKKLGIKEGLVLETPLLEFYYKKDALGDPFISDDQALMLKTVRSKEDLITLKTLALKVNEILISTFNKAEIDLVDFKIEFGYAKDGTIKLGDEISPDSCRLWDKKTKEKMDKDRFRRDLGDVVGFYKQVLERLKK